MSAVVVVVCGGVADCLVTPGIEVAIIDFDNLAQGDCVPALSVNQRALICQDVMAELEPHLPYAECQNCGKSIKKEDVVPLSTRGIFDRVSPGEIMPAGECPDCGCLASLYRTTMTETEQALSAELDELRKQLAEANAKVSGEHHASL